jgi:hypothetical protein
VKHFSNARFMMDECGLLCANDEFLCVSNFRSFVEHFPLYFQGNEDVGIFFRYLLTSLLDGLTHSGYYSSGFGGWNSSSQ